MPTPACHSVGRSATASRGHKERPSPGVAGAVDTVLRTIRSGVPIARTDLLDVLTVAAVNRFSDTTLEERPALFLKFHGTRSAVEE